MYISRKIEWCISKFRKFNKYKLRNNFTTVWYKIFIIIFALNKYW